MKSWSRNLSIGLVVCFIMVTIYAAFQLYMLPENMLKALDISELSKLEKAQGVSTNVYFVLSLDLLIVFMLIFMFSTYNFSHKAESIVYVEKEREYEEQEDKSHDDEVEVKVHEKMEALREKLDTLSREEEAYFGQVISAVCKPLEASVGALYKTEQDKGLNYVQFIAGYAFEIPESKKIRYEFGEGLAGQAAKSKKEFILSEVPEGYITSLSGLGSATPKNLMVIPIIEGDDVKGVVEIASFTNFSKAEVAFAIEAGKTIAGLFAEEQIQTQSA